MSKKQTTWRDLTPEQAERKFPGITAEWNGKEVHAVTQIMKTERVGWVAAFDILRKRQGGEQ